MILYLSVVLLGAQVFQEVEDQGVLVAQVFLGEQILVLRGVLPLMPLGARVVRGALFLGGLELFLELAGLWLDLKYVF